MKLCSFDARSKGQSLATPLTRNDDEGAENGTWPSPGIMARLGVPVGGRVRKLRAVEDQSAPIPEEKTSELGRIICSLTRRPQ